MSLTVTFDDTLYRTQLSATTLGATATYAVVERSANEVAWETVRGGTALPVTSEAASLDDYEYFANEQTFYRITSYDDSDVQQAQFTDNLTVAQTDVVLKSIRYTLLNKAVKLGDYTDLERRAQTGVAGIVGRSFPVATTDVNTGVRVSIQFVTETPADARDLSLLIALGDILYLQVPQTNSRRPPRSMYLVPDSSTLGRIGSGDHRRHTVPFTEVAAPSALVVGTTLTWANVWATYGSWTSLWAENSTWNDLLATVGDGEDLVVL